MHPIPHAGMKTYGCGRWGPRVRCVLFPVALFLLCLIYYHSVLLSPVLTAGQHPASSFARLDSKASPIYARVHHHTPCAHCADSARIPRQVAILTPTRFAIPVDTEPTDSESAVGKLTKPIFLILSCISRSAWQSTDVRCLFIPLYLFHQSMLC